MDDAPDPPPPPGSALNPFGLPETPPKTWNARKAKRRRQEVAASEPGSAANPWALPDTPPPRRRGINRGPPSTILPHIRQRDRQSQQENARARGRLDMHRNEDFATQRDDATRDIVAYDSHVNRRSVELTVTSHERTAALLEARRAADILETAQARIRAVEASVLNPVPANFGGPAAGSSRRQAVSRPSTVAAVRQQRQQQNISRRHVSMVAVLEAPDSPPLVEQRPTRGFYGGWRTPRRDALTRAELYQYGGGPPDQRPNKEHHKCIICLFVKCHPVSYACGHSHCYVCARLWLEQKWTCPECRAPMDRAPFRHYGEEAWIRDAYPAWDDDSVVDYSFRGLVFPTIERVLAPDSP